MNADYELQRAKGKLDDLKSVIDLISYLFHLQNLTGFHNSRNFERHSEGNNAIIEESEQGDIPARRASYTIPNKQNYQRFILYIFIKYVQNIYINADDFNYAIALSI